MFILNNSFKFKDEMIMVLSSALAKNLTFENISDLMEKISLSIYLFFTVNTSHLFCLILLNAWLKKGKFCSKTARIS
jgi:hypothetical protein